MRTLIAAPLVLFVLLGFRTAQATDLFYDDFADGDHADGSPVKWSPFAGFSDGSFNAASGDFVLTSNTVEGPLVVLADGASLADVSLRTQVRVVGSVNGISLFARFTGGVHTYQGGITTAGEAYIGWNDAGAKYHGLIDLATDLRPNQEDVSLQFDVIGNALKLYAWRSSDPMPALPTVEVTDGLISGPGSIGLLYDPSSVGNGLFRFVESAPVPEPSGMVLCALALLGLAAPPCLARRRSPGNSSARTRKASVR